MNLTELIYGQLATEPAESKKFRMVSRAMYYVMGLFIGAGAACYFKPEIAGSMAPLAQMAITAIGGLASVYAGAQAVVEYKANSVLQTQASANVTNATGQPCVTGPTGPAFTPSPITPSSTGAPPQPPFTPAAIVQ